jgi:hypothetical protein
MADNILDEADEKFVSGRDPESKQQNRTINAKQLRESQQGNKTLVKLTDWAKEPTLAELKQDLEAAKTSRDEQVTKINQWELAREGGKLVPKKRGRSSLRPKLIRRQAEWRYSSLSDPLLSSQDLFQVNPRTFEDGPAASQNAILVNWQFNTKIDTVKLVGEAVRTFVDEGTLILRPGWQREIEQAPTTVPVWQYVEVLEGSSEEQTLIQALETKEKNPRAFYDLDPAIIESIEYSMETGSTLWAVQVGEKEVLEDKIVKNQPTLKVVDYRNIYVDPSCGSDIHKATFIIESFTTSKYELAKDKRYKNLGSVNYGGAELMNDSEHGTDTPQDFNFPDEDRKKVVAYEYWGMADINNDGNLKPIVATWIDDQLIRMEENPFPDGKFPFIFAAYLPKKRSVFGEPDAELLEDNQKIIGAVTRGLIDLLGRSANSQQGIQKGMLDTTNRRRFENGEDYEFNPAANPNHALIQHKYPELPRSALEILATQNAEAESLSGVKAFSGGVSGEAYGKVVAGIKGALDAAAKREMDILRRLADCFKQAGERIIAMNAVFLTEKEIVRVTNEKFVEIKRDELVGEFDLVIDISTPEIDEQKAADLAFMLQTAASTLPFEFTQMILGKIARLRRMPELANMIENFVPQPDPLAEALKQLEVKKVEYEISKLESEIAKNRAAAEKLIAEADSIDLDTEMTGSGMKHAQDMEKQTEQARGNQDLAITKAIVAPRKKEDSPLPLEEAVGFNELTKAMATASNRPKETVPSVGAQLDPLAALAQ